MHENSQPLSLLRHSQYGIDATVGKTSVEQQQTVFHGESPKTVMLLISSLPFNLLTDLDGLFLEY